MIVIGGGLAGAAAAIGLAKAGHAITLFDKAATAQHKVCGEFLSHEAVDYLDRLRLDVRALGAVPVDRVRLLAGHRAIETRLPFRAWSLSRYRLDEALLAHAEAQGVVVRRGAVVQALQREQAGWTLRLAGETRAAPAIFLATGKHDLRGYKRPPGRQNELVAFKMHYRLNQAATTALAGAVELALFPGGYAGLELVEDGIANLCLLVQRQVLAKIGGGWNDVQAYLAAAPQLAARLHDATPLWQKPLTIAAIPYGLVQRETEPGLWRLGDQAAVIPSFAGDGMAIALHSAAKAVHEFQAGQAAPDYQRQLAAELAGQVGRATLLSQALVQPLGRGILPYVAGLWPGLLARTASLTRVAAEYRLSA